MAGDQLPLFQRKVYKGIISSLPMEIHAPTADSTVKRYFRKGYQSLDLVPKNTKPERGGVKRENGEPETHGFK